MSENSKKSARSGSKPSRGKARVSVSPGADQADLFPDLHHPAAKELRSLARSYYKLVREGRALLAKEVEIKGKILGLMHDNDLKTFELEDVSITIKVKDETVKVKMRDEDEE